MEKDAQRESRGPTCHAASLGSPRQETNCIRRETRTLEYVDEKRRGSGDRFKMGKYNGASSSAVGVEHNAHPLLARWWLAFLCHAALSNGRASSAGFETHRATTSKSTPFIFCGDLYVCF